MPLDIIACYDYYCFSLMPLIFDATLRAARQARSAISAMPLYAPLPPLCCHFH
jgi:hypothetical protein